MLDSFFYVFFFFVVFFGFARMCYHWCLVSFHFFPNNTTNLLTYFYVQFKKKNFEKKKYIRIIKQHKRAASAFHDKYEKKYLFFFRRFSIVAQNGFVYDILIYFCWVRVSILFKLETILFDTVINIFLHFAP